MRLYRSVQKIISDKKDFWTKKPSEITDSWAVLEIVAGKLNWVWKASGRRAPNIISTTTIVSDNKWHTVRPGVVALPF